MPEKMSHEAEWELAQQAWNEAAERLSGDDADLLQFTHTANASEVLAYITEHEKQLSPEARFFLDMSLQIKNMKERRS